MSRQRSYLQLLKLWDSRGKLRRFFILFKLNLQILRWISRPFSQSLDLMEIAQVKIVCNSSLRCSIKTGLDLSELNNSLRSVKVLDRDFLKLKLSK
jgi:hypothetical protein